MTLVSTLCPHGTPLSRLLERDGIDCVDCRLEYPQAKTLLEQMIHAYSCEDEAAASDAIVRLIVLGSMHTYAAAVVLAKTFTHMLAADPFGFVVFDSASGASVDPDSMPGMRGMMLAIRFIVAVSNDDTDTAVALFDTAYAAMASDRGQLIGELFSALLDLSCNAMSQQEADD